MTISVFICSGKFCDDIVDTDMTVFIVESKPSWKLVAFTNTTIDGVGRKAGKMFSLIFLPL